MQGSALAVGGVGPALLAEVETCTDSTHPGPPYKSGGPLAITKTNYTIGKSGNLSCSNANGVTWYKGRFWISPPSLTGVTLNPLSVAELNGWGTKGYNRGLPVHNVANLGLAAAEARDIPDMVKSTHRFFSQFKGQAFSGKSGSFWSEAYLNAQFGWKPFLNDFWDMLTFQNQLAAKIQWLRKNNRKTIHRHFTLSESSSDTRIAHTETFATMLPILATQFYDTLSGRGVGVTETWERRSTRIWFDGAFTFYIPGLDSFPDHDWRLKLKLLGLYPDLNLIYKATPWTWLLDWFTSAGAAIQNASLMQEYGQLAKYAYVMSHQKVERTTYAYQYVKIGKIADFKHTLVQALSKSSKETKQRAVANPYGFGVTWDGLNPFQLSILTALGLTRSHSGS